MTIITLLMDLPSVSDLLSHITRRMTARWRSSCRREDRITLTVRPVPATTNRLERDVALSANIQRRNISVFALAATGEATYTVCVYDVKVLQERYNDQAAHFY